MGDEEEGIVVIWMIEARVLLNLHDSICWVGRVCVTDSTVIG